MNTRTQREKILAWLLVKPMTTLDARNELFIMAPAARVFELKDQGFRIYTTMVPASLGCKRLIAQYVLLSGGQS